MKAAFLYANLEDKLPRVKLEHLERGSYQNKNQNNRGGGPVCHFYVMRKIYQLVQLFGI